MKKRTPVLLVAALAAMGMSAGAPLRPRGLFVADLRGFVARYYFTPMQLA